jgi:hypothetical protein
MLSGSGVGNFLGKPYLQPIGGSISIYNLCIFLQDNVEISFIVSDYILIFAFNNDTVAVIHAVGIPELKVFGTLNVNSHSPYSIKASHDTGYKNSACLLTN